MVLSLMEATLNDLNGGPLILVPVKDNIFREVHPCYANGVLLAL